MLPKLLLSLSTSLLLLLPSPASAGVYVTNPVASTVGTGMQSLTVEWADDGLTPFLSNISTSSVDLYTGSQTQQYWLQNLAEAVNVAQTSKVSAMIEGDVGSDGQYYFIRFTSAALKSSANPAYPYEAFSAVFTLNGMTGSLNQTVMTAINAAAASNGTTAVGTNSTSGTATGTTSTSRLTTTTTSAATGTTAKSSASNGTTTSSAAAKATTSSTSAGPANIVGPDFHVLVTGTIAVGMLFSGLALVL